MTCAIYRLGLQAAVHRAAVRICDCHNVQSLSRRFFCVFVHVPLGAGSGEGVGRGDGHYVCSMNGLALPGLGRTTLKNLASCCHRAQAQGWHCWQRARRESEKVPDCWAAAGDRCVGRVFLFEASGGGLDQVGLYVA